jgi:hypothetical protein
MALDLDLAISVDLIEVELATPRLRESIEQD